MKTVNVRGARARGLLVLFAAMGAAGCSGNGGSEITSSGDPEADQRAEMLVGSGKDGKGDARTLYERLGGTRTIAAIVDDMTERSIADPRVNFARKNIKTNWLGDRYDEWEATPENVGRFKERMVEFLTLAAGGPVEYTGRDMRSVHRGMRITNNEFDAMVGDIKTSMTAIGVPAPEMKDLLAIVETTRKQIVEKN